MPAGIFPIVYVRGYAMRQSDIDEAADDPFCGFAVGSTAHRPDAKADAEPVAFEGPLVRLMTDFGYIDSVETGKHNVMPGQSHHPIDALRTVWIFRYYDNVSSRFEDQLPRREDMIRLGLNLYDFIGLVRHHTGAEKVHLVAHSMGGLICRCLLQNIYTKVKRKKVSPGWSPRDVGEIARFFTYATPHNGIESQRRTLNPLGRVFQRSRIWAADVFHPKVMARYLHDLDSDIPIGYKANELSGFPLPDAYCLVGTNSADYPAAYGISKRAIGPASDGLVLIKNAFIRGAGRAHLHRCHSGPFGIVNSEEAYHLLVNFLFGGVLALELLPEKAPSGPHRPDTPLLVDVSVSRRGGAEPTSDSSRRRFSSVRLPEGYHREEMRTILTLPVPYFDETYPLAYRIEIGLTNPAQEAGENSYLAPQWTGMLVVQSLGTRLRFGWQRTDFSMEEEPTLQFPDLGSITPGPMKLRLRLLERPEPGPWLSKLERPLSGGGQGEAKEVPVEEPSVVSAAEPIVEAKATKANYRTRTRNA